jgi:hypothetical protein
MDTLIFSIFSFDDAHITQDCAAVLHVPRTAFAIGDWVWHFLEGERAEKILIGFRQAGRLVRMIIMAHASRRAAGGSMRIKSAVVTATADGVKQGRTGEDGLIKQLECLLHLLDGCPRGVSFLLLSQMVHRAVQ